AGLPYVEGEAFFAEVAHRLGYRAAVERVFSDPPVVLRQVVNPAEYLAPKVPAITDAVRAAVAEVLRPEEGSVRVSPFPAPALRAALPALPEEVVARGLGGYREGVL